MASKNNTPFNIAIIGLSCRFPGAENSEEFWKLLEKGSDAITEIPSDRFDLDAYYNPDPDKPGTIYTRYGGFLTQVDQFDPTFFGIPPRAADAIDPQQRLALEVSWEALENAAIPPSTLKKRQIGVFIGVSENDYAQIAYQTPTQIDLYSGTGNLQAFVAGRIAYVLGVQGQTQSIDTACSSSLVAIHTACQALRLEECELALAGGVHVILGPDNYIFLSRAKALSPDGRSKAFDASANGFSRGEGCGMVVLKRLAEAERDGDNILAVIRASVVNNDGPSGGLTVPNVAAQEQLLRTALQRAALDPQQVSYLEAHGTGTILGDPLELQAAGKVYGPDREPDQPLYIGSVKSNIGHSEPAAGIAGLIKVILAMRHGQLPKHLHFNTPNPRIPWHKLPFQVVTETMDWSVGHQIAGISSFGMSGTNAHLLVEAYQEKTPVVAETAERPVHLLPLSAKTAPALQSLATCYLEWLNNHPDTALADIGFTAATGRDHFAHRAAIVIDSEQQLTENLNQLAQAQTDQRVFVNHNQQFPCLVMLFTGQGSQSSGMGQGIYETQPVFRQTLDRCAAILKPLLDIPLQPLLFDSAYKEKLNQTRYTQPALFALEVALYEWWRSVGIEPDIVMGHSVGEYAAAYAAGVFSLEDGLRLIAKRAELMARLPADGAMVAIFAKQVEVEAAITGTPLSIAADNGAHQVISGPQTDVQTVASKFESTGVRIQRLQTSHAFHSALLEPVLDEFAHFTATIDFHLPQRTLISNLTGTAFTASDIPNSGYWCRHSREPVQFAQSCAAVAEQGGNVLLEIGPHPVLTAMAAQCWPNQENPAVIGSLRRNKNDNRQLVEAVARLYVAGSNLDWKAWDAPWRRHKLNLPTYPFQRQRYWVETPEVSTLTRKPAHPSQQTGDSSVVSKPVVSTQIKNDSTLIHTLPNLAPHERQPLLLSHLQQALQEILRLAEAPPPETDFFDFGLDSLMAVELRNRIQVLIGQERTLSSTLIFEHPTLTRLASHLEGLLSTFTHPSSPIVKPTQVQQEQDQQNDFIPLSAGQQALWFIYREAPESAAYNTSLLLQFELELDVQVLQRALQQLTARRSVLRSRLGEAQGVPYQWIEAAPELAFHQRDATAWNEATLMEQVQQVSQQPFVLEECVFRVDGFLNAPQGPLLLLGLHHIAGDARSMAILGQELLALYNAEAQRKTANLPSLSADYAAYVRWENELLNSDSKDDMAAYWQQQLAGEVPILQLPTDRPRPPAQTFNGASLRFSLSAELTQQLRELARQEQSTLFGVLLTAFQILLYRYTGQEDIWLGVPTSTARSQPAFAELVGYLVNPMVIRGQFLSGQQASFCDKVALTQRQILTGLDHQPYPFPLLIEQLQPVRDPSYPPLIQAMFSYETQALIPKRFAAEGISAQSIALAQMEGQFDVSLTFDDDDHALTGILSYNSDLFLPETARRMAEHLQVLLQGIAHNPNADICNLQLLTRAETQQLLEWNRTDTDYPAEKTIVDLFEQQVEKTPLNIAVVFEQQQLTYQQLNEQANQLAHDLLALKNQASLPDNPLIAIAVERSIEMVIGLLGILKAGGAYVPIDPTYPTARIQYMLEDSKASVLLTQSHLKAQLPVLAHDCVIVCLDDGEFANQPAINPTLNRQSDDLAYVIYTSGSTGMPKGVMIEHQGLVNLASAQINQFCIIPVLYYKGKPSIAICFHEF